MNINKPYNMTGFERMINNAINQRKFTPVNGYADAVKGACEPHYIDRYIAAEIELGERDRLDLACFADTLMRHHQSMGALGALEILAKTSRSLGREIRIHPGIEAKPWYPALRAFGDAIEKLEYKTVDQETIRRLREEE